MKPTLRMHTLAALVAALTLVAAGAPAAAGGAVGESARELPVAYEVDVVVVGGGTGAVSAAVAAAGSGASVFLAAPYPYLGDDMTATLRLWLEEGERPKAPLAKAVYADPLPQLLAGGAHPARVELSYTASLPTGAPHHDTTPPSRLTNGAWGDAARQSVQYNGSVTLDADLGRRQAVRKVRMVVYHRDHDAPEKDFKVERVKVSTSREGEVWTEAAVIENDDLPAGITGPIGAPVLLAAPVEAEARYVRFDVMKADDAERVLVGEIEVVGAEGEEAAARGRPQPPRPLHVKKTLEKALLDAGVEFLFSCYPTDVLRDAAGAPAGIVMANRAGRQAVLARTIIDATDRGTVARLAGARFRPYPSGTHTFRRVVVGGEPVEGETPARAAGKMGPSRIATVRVIDPPFQGFCNCSAPQRCPACLGQSLPSKSPGTFAVIEYTLPIDMADGSFASFAAADQAARTLTYHPAQQATADRLFQVPPDAMHGRQSVEGDDLTVEALPLDAFRPEGVDRLYLLGGAADVSRARAERLLRPLELIDLGARIGAVAAEEAAAVGELAGVRLPGDAEAHAGAAAAGDVCELLAGVRPIGQLPTIAQEARDLPILGRYDVLVIGGGTGGAPAGIAAAREGARVLVVEYLHMLGGVGTAGYITRYWRGDRGGFTATVPGGAAWQPEQRAQWWRQTLLDEGATIWFGTIGCGAVVEADRVIGAVVATPEGRGVVLADVVVDSTGNADIAAAAGAETDYTDAREFGMQGTGLPPRRLGASYTNTDFTIVDETDMVDIWHVFVYSKQKYPEAFDQAQLIDTRERRRIVGDFYMTVLDQMVGRTYPDTIARAYSNFDSHGYTIDPYLMLRTPPRGDHFWVNIPYRCLLPKGLDGLLATGLGISVHRDAVPLVRMQPCIQNQGYAAGLAAATAAREGAALRAIDIGALQRKLVEIGNLPKEVLNHADSVPMPADAIAEAVRQAPGNYRARAIVFLHRDEALPLLRRAYQSSEGDRQYAYARMLGMLGDATGADRLTERVRGTKQWDRGWNYHGGGQWGDAMSALDRTVVALGVAGVRDAVPHIVAITKLLDADSAFSHHRAAAFALERLGDPAAAPALAELLAKPGMSGYVHDTVYAAKAHDGVDARHLSAVHTRRESLREMLVARALYRLGDHEGVGEATLRAYASDLRGHLARHAQAVLDES